MMDRILLDQAEKNDGSLVVLYYLPDNSYTPYVTWLALRDTPEKTYLGHYFETIEEAEENLEKRAFTTAKGFRLYDVVRGLGGSCGDYMDIHRGYTKE